MLVRQPTSDSLHDEDMDFPESKVNNPGQQSLKAGGKKEPILDGYFLENTCLCMLSARHKVQNLFKPQQQFWKINGGFFCWILRSDLLAGSAVTAHNRTLRTKPFCRPYDQVVRTWSWSMGRQNTPLVLDLVGQTI